MEQRSVILAAVVLALAVSGFGFARFIPNADLADQLSTSAANNSLSGSNVSTEEELSDNSESEDGANLVAANTESDVAGAVDGEVFDQPIEEESNEDVPLTAETGASEVALLAMIAAILVGATGLFRISREH